MSSNLTFIKLNDTTLAAFFCKLAISLSLDVNYTFVKTLSQKFASEIIPFYLFHYPREFSQNNGDAKYNELITANNADRQPLSKSLSVIKLFRRFCSQTARFSANADD